MMIMPKIESDLKALEKLADGIEDNDCGLNDSLNQLALDIRTAIKDIENLYEALTDSWELK